MQHRYGRMMPQVFYTGGSIRTRMDASDVAQKGLRRVPRCITPITTWQISRACAGAGAVPEVPDIAL
jgi:hypothetical protein